MNNPVVQVKGLTKRYGRSAAVSDVSFVLEKGEVVGFVGLNGAGKSTTINMLLGFLGATAGTIEVFGSRVTTTSAYMTHRRIGYASGDMELPANLTGKQYFSFVSGVYGQADKEKLVKLIERFEPQLTKRIGELSRGNRQKIALIAAFLPSPELVILDEPSSGLDPLMQQKFLELVREEAAAGTTILMSSHYLQEVSESCSRILLIRDGHIMRDVATSELERLKGKHVTVHVETAVKPPKEATSIEYLKDGVSFVYAGNPAELQQWLAGINGLLDFTVEDHDPEAAFEELYEEAAHA